jgi:serine/threonine protein kinase
LKKYTVVQWPSEIAARNGLYEEIYRQLDAADLQGEMQLDWSQFRLGDHKVGSGSFGMVFKSACRDGKYVAFKQIVGGDLFPRKDLEMAKKEMGTMASLCHRNIIGILWSNVDPLAKDCEGNYIGIGFAMKLAEQGNLRQFIDSKDDAWAIAERVNLFLDVAAGLCYLHTRPSPVLHRDLKSANVLVCTHHDGSLVGKLCDFGMSKTITASRKTARTDFKYATLPWSAPELLKRVPFKSSADIYSLAMVGYELVTRKFPFEDVEHLSLMGLLYEGKERPKLREDTSACLKTDKHDNLLAFIERMWHSDANQRPNARQVVKELLDFSN